MNYRIVPEDRAVLLAAPRRGSLYRRAGVLLLAGWLVAVSGTLAAQAPEEEEIETVPMDFEDIDLKVVLDAVAEFTGKRFLYQGGTGGQQGQGIGTQKVYFRCPKPIPLTRVYEIFEAMMELHNFALIETGSPDSRIVKVVPKDKANIKAVDYVDVDELEAARVEDRYVTYAFNFKYISDGLRVQQQLRTIAPGQNDGLMILGVQNLPFIILSGFAPTVYRLHRILTQMDVPPAEDQIVVLPIYYAVAGDIKALIDPLLQRRPGAGSPQGGGAYVVEDQPQIQADDRTNSLIIQGSPKGVGLILGIVEKLDTQVDSTTRFHIVRLKHSVAEDIAVTLTNVIQGLRDTQGGAQGGRGRAPGTPPGTPTAVGTGSIAGDINVTSDLATNSLIVVALERDFQEVRAIIDELDRRKRQVYIEAAFVEVSSTSNLAHAVELAGIDLANDMGVRVAGATFFSGENGPFSVLVDDQGQPTTGVPAGRLPLPPSNGALISVFNNDLFSVPLMLRALAAQSDVQVVATPRVLANDNENAVITVRTEEPTSSINTTETGVTSQTFAGTEDAITQLDITPHIGADDELNLEIHQTIEQFGERPIAGLPPAKISREIQTRVTIPNNHTIILGGLRAKSSRSTVTKVPMLGDIPLLGTLFQFRETTDQTGDIYIFLTARILKDTNFRDMMEYSQGAKEDLEEDTSLDTLEGIDRDYRHALDLGGAASPTYYFDTAHPGDSQPGAGGQPQQNPAGGATPTPGNVRPLRILYDPNEPLGVAPEEHTVQPAMPAGDTYTPPVPAGGAGPAESNGDQR